MEKSSFRIDLGQGDITDVQSTPGKSLAEFITELRASDEWLDYGDTGIQKSHIKRVQKLS